MNRMIQSGAMLLLIASLGCEKRGDSSETPATGAGADVDRAVAVVKGIEANRASAESVLAAHDLTAEGFDSLMYTIAADSAKAAAYAKAVD